MNDTAMHFGADGKEPVFREPWEAHAFALAVSLHQRGLFTWPEWAEALAQSGEVDRARHLAARLREFRNPNSDEFFAPCAPEALAPRPFQCEPPTNIYDWRDFR